MRSLENRFFSKVAQSGSDPVRSCWVWQAATFRTGYGAFRLAGGVEYAHRWSWGFFNGPLPPGLNLDHLCRDRGCVNPHHLDAVTTRINTQRGAQARRNRGHVDILTDLRKEARELYATGSCTQRAVANLLGMDQSTVSRAVNEVLA